MSQIIRCYAYPEPGKLNLDIVVRPLKGDRVSRINDFIQSFEIFPQSKFSIEFTVSYLSSDLEILLPKEERGQFTANTKLAIRYICKGSRQRNLIELNQNISLEQSDKLFFSAEKEFNPEELSGDIEFTCLLVRVKGVGEESGFLTEKYSLLAESPSRRLYVDPFTQSAKGGQLDVRIGTLEFNQGETRLDALYQLKIDTSEIIINKNAPPNILKALEHEYQNDGPNKKLQDAFLAPMIVDVWEQLAREAFSEMMPIDSEDEPLDPSDLTHPLNKIAEAIALVLYPGELEDAKESLVEKLSEPESRTFLINRQLPLAVQVIGELPENYELASEAKFKF